MGHLQEVAVAALVQREEKAIRLQDGRVLWSAVFMLGPGVSLCVVHLLCVWCIPGVGFK